jgi:hypothetical protein
VGNIGVEVFGFALGDHGIFCRRQTPIVARKRLSACEVPRRLCGSG